MIRRLLAKLPYLLWFLPGFLLWASFPPMGEKMDVFFALAPLLWFIRRETPKRSFACAFTNGFFFWFATLAWMPAIVKNGGPLFLVILGWGVLAAYCALYFGLFGWFSSQVWRWVGSRGYAWRLAALVVAEPLLWAGLELIRSRLLGGFAWNQLGVAPINAGFGAPAALGGVYLVSAVVVLVNGTFASIAERMTASYEQAKNKAGMTSAVPKWVRSIETILPFLLILSLYRATDTLNALASGPSSFAPPRCVSFGLMQRNFPCVFKTGEELSPAEAYRQMLDALKPVRPDVLVLPESAFGEVAPVDAPRAVRFVEGRFGELQPSAVIAGGAREDKEGRLYNSAAVYSLSEKARVEEVQIYDKVHLVPFGEFIPGDKLFPVLQKLAPVGSCTPGELKVVSARVRDEEVKLGLAICYEDTDSSQMRQLAAQGAQVLVFVTNDSWFSHSDETVQHAWNALARAIETGLPVVRVGNSGVSGTVFPNGRADWLRTDDGRDILVDATGAAAVLVPVSPVPGLTPYVSLGDAPLFLAFLLLITTMGVIKYKHDYEKRRTVSL